MTSTRMFVLVFGIFLGAAYALWPQPDFNLIYLGQQCYLNTRQFTLQWRHSVEHQLWREHYVWQAGSLHLDKTEMQTFGAGTPASGRPTIATPGFVAQTSTVVLPELNWVVSRRMEGEIHTNRGTWLLYQHVPDYTVILIQPVRRMRAQQWLGAHCDEQPTH